MQHCELKVERIDAGENASFKALMQQLHELYVMFCNAKRAILSV